MSFLELTQGPLWYLASAVFVIGVLWRLIGILRLGRSTDRSVARASGLGGALKAIALHSVPHGGNLKRTLYHFITGYGFHLGLFVLLFFAAPHVAFIKGLTGFGWTPLPRWGFLIAAEAAFAGLILMWLRRMTDPVMRRLSDADDHIATWLVFVVMLTGCLALQEAHDSLRALHLLCVEALMIYFPFSRLMHAFTFLFARAYTGATYGRRGVTP
ncbi:MAG: respiratory nitrate reductase subunit gamma [Allgaiera sp.]|jgi:nitrate reductase gamma subunit|nr:respiratory nitrate reductase subunit gamma [Allgaiera sp.]